MEDPASPHYHAQMMTGSLTVGALGCFLLLLLACIWWKKGSSSASSHPTGPPPTSHRLPLPPGSMGFLWVGETLKLLRALRVGDPSSFVRERTAKFQSKIFKTMILFSRTAVVQGMAANRFIAAAESKQQLMYSLPASTIKILGEHVPAAMHGPPHRRLRQIMTSCLGPVALRKLVDRADLITQLHFDSCWPKVESQVSLVSLLRHFTFRVACSLLTGIQDEAVTARIFEQFQIWSEGVVSLPLDLPGTAYRKAKNAKRMLLRDLGKIIDARVQELSNTDDDDPQSLKNAANLMCVLLQARNENGILLNSEELQDNILFLLLAGHDTTSATLSFVLKYLEQNPSCYHRLRQEHEAIASQKKPGEMLAWEDIQNMKYTWAVIQETMRLRPVSTGSMREAKYDLDFDGYRIPRGWKMVFFMSSTHDDQQYFPKPHEFDPSRFEIEKLQEGKGLPPYVFIPFGIGPHSCPGGDFARMIISIHLHHLALRKFKWISIDPDEKVHVPFVMHLAKSYPAKIFIDT